AWAFEKMIEDNLYWVIVHDRWVDDANFRKGPVRFFDRVPAPIRPLVVAMIRRKVRGALRGHGLGRHSNDEILALGKKSIAAIADFLGDKPFFFGPEPTGVDATVFAFVAGALCPHFDSRTRTAAEQRATLRRSVGRMTARFYPELQELAGCQAAECSAGEAIDSLAQRVKRFDATRRLNLINNASIPASRAQILPQIPDSKVARHEDKGEVTAF